MRYLKRLLREPLFHFLVIGGWLFLLWSAVSGPAPAPANSIIVGPERVAQLAAGYEAVWKRPPSDRELQTIVDNFVREEVYYREALALGLDRDDTIIRRRLQQKMEFLTDSGADIIEPETGELEAYYRANEEEFQDAPVVSLEQIYLGQAPTPDRIASTLAALQSDEGADPLSFGERTMLPYRTALATSTQIDGAFGSGFFAALEQLPMGEWEGPVESGYGLHLARVNDRRAARVPPLKEVRDEMLREWKQEKAAELREQVYLRLRERYVVELPDGMTLSTP